MDPLRLDPELGDPAPAWSAEASDLLPGPVGMYTCLALVVVGPFAVFHWVRLRWDAAWLSALIPRRAVGSRWQVRRLAARPAGALDDPWLRRC